MIHGRVLDQRRFRLFHRRMCSVRSSPSLDESGKLTVLGFLALVPVIDDHLVDVEGQSAFDGEDGPIGLDEGTGV